MRTALAVLAAGSLVAGCGSAPAEAPPGLTAAVEQSRDNENRRLLQLVVTNEGDDVVQVRQARLASKAYAQVPPAVFDQQVRPGSRTAFPVPYGDVRCGDEPAGASVVLGLADGGSVREVRVPVPDEASVLPRLHQRDCALAALAEAVDVALTGPWEREGDAVTGRLRLTRRSGDRTVRVTDAQSSIILLLQPSRLPLELAPGAGTAEAPVVVRAVRCDPHALIESKRTFTFPVFVALGDAEPLSLSVTADERGRAAMDEALRERCAALGIDLGEAAAKPARAPAAAG